MAENKSSGASGVLKKILVGIVFLLLLALVITFLVFNFTYSEGSRAGVLMKFSKRGYVFKTYEGELNTGGVGNIANTAQVNQVWYFSVKDNGFADTLHLYEGKKVILFYQQKIKHLPWQGETDYFVNKVQEVK
ncbi:MAG: 6-phosphogluconate dehydrogenase [Bacteroidetes bacterium]|nr:6-phosphogluconate dehydrogenase [Bacteroidota bacterium]